MGETHVARGDEEAVIATQEENSEAVRIHSSGHSRVDTLVGSSLLTASGPD